MISIVDDDESVREALWGLVRSVGYTVSTFASAEEFVNSDQLGKADCLILDVAMPGMGGIELQRRLVADHSPVPVIFITAHEDEGIRAQALRNGAEAFLIKPFSEDALLDAIQGALSAQWFFWSDELTETPAGKPEEKVRNPTSKKGAAGK
jgi:FixJ family two-component response regulator